MRQLSRLSALSAGVVRPVSPAEKAVSRRVVDEEGVSGIGLLILFQKGFRILPEFSRVDVRVQITDKGLSFGLRALQHDLILRHKEDHGDSDDDHEDDADEGDEDPVFDGHAEAAGHKPLLSRAENRNSAAPAAGTPSMAG